MTIRRVWNPELVAAPRAVDGPIDRLLVWASGADRDVLARAVTEQHVFTSLGGVVLGLAALAGAASWVVVHHVAGPVGLVAGPVAGGGAAVMVAVLYRNALSLPMQDRQSIDWAVLALALFAVVFVAFVISMAVQLSLVLASDLGRLLLPGLTADDPAASRAEAAAQLLRWRGSDISSVSRVLHGLVVSVYVMPYILRVFSGTRPLHDRLLAKQRQIEGHHE